jgi:hypothetical protein
VGILLNQRRTNDSILGGSERTLWQEEKGNVKDFVDETSDTVCTIHSFHK